MASSSEGEEDTVTLMLPDAAFDALDVPLIGHRPEAAERRLLLAARLLMMGAIACQKLERSLKASGLIPQVEHIEALDALVIDYASAVLPAEAWQQIAATLAGFGERAIPRAYQGRDKRIPALFIYLRDVPSGDPEAMRLFAGFASACRYDGAHYNAILANLVNEGVLEEVAEQVLSHLTANADAEEGTA